MVKRRVLVSGADSFVGRAFIEHLVLAGHRVSAIYCGETEPVPGAVSWIAVGDLATRPLSVQAGQGIDVYVNLTSKDPAVSSSGAVAIARNISDFVIAAEIRLVIVASSIAAAIAEKGDIHARRYGMDVLAADQIYLNRLAGECHLIIVRPPAIYGAGMQNSLSMLAAMVRSGLPIPLGSANEPRHYISIRNFCDLLETMVRGDEKQWANASGKIFEPSDDKAVSTRCLVRMIGDATGKRVVLFPFPRLLLRALGAASGRNELISGAIDRLDLAPSLELEAAFGWHPVEQMPESLAYFSK